MQTILDGIVANLYNIYNNNNNLIYVLYYLRAGTIAMNPVTETAQEYKRK
jgi:hypothetical protein